MHALEIGADDYLVKPFSMRELVARVARRRGAACGRRRRSAARRSRSRSCGSTRARCRRSSTAQSAGLTPTEFRLLYTLALDRGRVVTRDELLQKVWGRRETHRDRTVDVFVRRLRQKIDPIAPRHSFIQTRFGVGYKLEAEPKRPCVRAAAIVADRRFRSAIDGAQTVLERLRQAGVDPEEHVLDPDRAHVASVERVRAGRVHSPRRPSARRRR